MSLVKDKDNCSGCNACMLVCPVNAISMIEDKEGFAYPTIDDEKCINCNLCVATCPFDEGIEKFNSIKKSYAIKNKENAIRINSSSGGVFTAISDHILDANGIVYGAAFNDDFIVKHIRADNKIQRDRCVGSKYVQSNLNGVFQEVADDIEKGRKVFFTGVPCQIAGLKAYLNQEKIDMKNLVTTDLICHGANTPIVLRDFVQFLKEKVGIEVKDINFRDKSYGWHKSKTSIIDHRGANIVNKNFTNVYNNIFYSHFALRPSCYTCPFAQDSRVGDITIGDYWGIENYYPDFDDNRGVSLVLVNTDKGMELFKDVLDSFEYLETKRDTIWQRALIEPAHVNKERRRKFWDLYRSKGFLSVSKKYTDYGIVRRSKKFLKKCLNINEC